MKGRIPILLVCLLCVFASALPAQKKGSEAKGKANAATDGQRAYQNKCMSCHRETHKYVEGKQAAVVLHMRVRGDLTEKETQAILRYLTQ